MNYRSKGFIHGIILLLAACAAVAAGIAFYTISMKKVSEPRTPTQVIVVGIDGMQSAHVEEMRLRGTLPHISRLIGADGTSTSISIGLHKKTETAPGNAEIHSGLGEEKTGVYANSCKNKPLPVGTSIFERLNAFNPDIALGSIYGKSSCYIPLPLLLNAKPIIDWWHDRASYEQRTYVSSNCADSRDVALKARDFLDTHKAQSFYLFVYFGAPDCAGHAYGENSIEYEHALINADKGLGIILDNLHSLSLSPSILVTSDHGWNEDTKGHSNANADTKLIPLITNDASLVDGITPKNPGMQCDIAPTVLNIFGVPRKNYKDITNAGCAPLSK